MSYGQTPTRVMMLDDDRYCTTDVSDRRGLIETRWTDRWTDSWCFCGAVSHSALSNVSMNHCHLLDKLYHQHVSENETLNGKRNCSVYRLRRPPPCDSTVRLSTVSCSYQIPSNVECLDLAVNGLQRISGSYFVTRQLPCVLSVCRCHKSAASNRMADLTVTDSGNKSTRKRPESDRLSSDSLTSDKFSVADACELEALYRDDNSSVCHLETPQRRRRQQELSHCTRSSSKHLIDTSIVEDSTVSTSGTRSSSGQLIDTGLSLIHI